MSVTVAIRKRLGTFSLDASFEVPAGITALFGPSGSGKTLTLRCIAGLVRPDSGRIAVGERVLFDSARRIDVPTRERRIGYLFQHYALFPHLTVAANVAYGLHRLPRAARAARVAELLRMVELEAYANRKPRELSGGQQQRVALARALAPAPDLLLLDEPFSAVDALVRAQLRSELRAIQAQTRVPMLLVTHDIAEVRQLASCVVLYDHGQILAAGPPAEVLAPGQPGRVAALLAAAEASA